MTLFDKDALIEKLTSYAWNEKVSIEVLDMICGFPPAPVVHGHWIEHYAFGCFHYDCSICDDGFAIKNKQKELPNYCANCGAKMDGGGEK